MIAIYIRQPEASLNGATVVVTVFRCRSLLAMIWVRWKAMLLTKEIATLADGLMHNSVTWSPRKRTVCNVSVWRDRNSVYAMGRSDRHIRLARRVLQKRVATTESIVFDTAGEWREVLFREPYRRSSMQGSSPWIDLDPPTAAM